MDLSPPRIIVEATDATVEVSSKPPLEAAQELADATLGGAVATDAAGGDVSWRIQMEEVITVSEGECILDIPMYLYIYGRLLSIY